MLKRFVCILLGMVLVFNLAACSKPTAGGPVAVAVDANGVYYEEKELGGSSGWKNISNIKLNSKKQTVIYDEGIDYHMEDGKTAVPRFITLDTDGKEISSFDCTHDNGKGRNVTRSIFTLDDQDNIYLLNDVVAAEEKDNASKEKEAVVVTEAENSGAAKALRFVHIYDANGNKIKTLELGKTGSGMDYVFNIMADAKGNIYISSMAGLKSYDKAGKPIKKVDSGKIIAADIDGDGNLLYIAREQGKLELQKYDPASEQVAWHQELKETGHISGIYYNAIDKHIYIADSKGINKYDDRGNYVSQLLDYDDTSIIPMEQYLTGFVIDAANNIYMTMRQQSYDDKGKPFKLIKFAQTKDDGKRAERKILTLAVMNQNMMLESMAKKFQQKHPDIKVEIKSMGEDVNINDAVKKFNAEIMSGKAADLICLDGLPYKKYIDKNIFANISEIIVKDSTFDTGQYYSNILEACKYKGSLYAMPVSFSFGAVEVDKALTDGQDIRLDENSWTWKTFKEAVLKVVKDKNNDGKTDIYGLSKIEPLELFGYVFSSNMKQFIDMENRKCNFDSKAFVEVLETVKALSDNKTMHATLDNGALFNNGSSGTIGFNLINDMNTFAYTVAKNMLGSKTEVLAMPLSSENQLRTFDAVLFAINNNSKLKPEAWEFIKFLTAGETFGGSIPVNKNASENMMKEMMNPENQASIGVTTESGKTKVIVIEPLTDKQYEHMKGMIASLGQRNDYDGQLKSIIEGELKAYLSGQRSAEDIAKLIQNRVNIYLNE